MPPITQKDLASHTENLAKLIKSEISGLRSEVKSEIGELRADMEKRFAFQKRHLESYIDGKFEINRRLLVDEMQNFQDAIITEVKTIKQETIVNSGHRLTLVEHETRIDKIERHLFSN